MEVGAFSSAAGFSSLVALWAGVSPVAAGGAAEGAAGGGIEGAVVLEEEELDDWAAAEAPLGWNTQTQAIVENQTPQ